MLILVLFTHHAQIHLTALLSIFDLGRIIIVFDVYPDVCNCRRPSTSNLVCAIMQLKLKGDIHGGTDDHESLLPKQFQK
jgi:hypothetical protein